MGIHGHLMHVVMAAGLLTSCVDAEGEADHRTIEEDLSVTGPDKELAPESVDSFLYGCGLEYRDMGSYYAYTVVNCHPYPVKRRVVFSDGNPGACRCYGVGTPYNLFEGTSIRRPDHLINCASDPCI